MNISVFIFSFYKIFSPILNYVSNLSLVIGFLSQVTEVLSHVTEHLSPVTIYLPQVTDFLPLVTINLPQVAELSSQVADLLSLVVADRNSFKLTYSFYNFSGKEYFWSKPFQNYSCGR